MPCQLTNSEINHLRRLLGWVSCEVGQEPGAQVTTVKKLVELTKQEVSDEGKTRLIEAYQKVSKVPKYVRAAVKALNKTLEPHIGDTVDAEYHEQFSLATEPLPAPLAR